MWIAEKSRSRQEPEPAAQLGQVTLPEDPAGVYLDGERRNLPVFAPGGYVWRPSRGRQVLVIKTGAGGALPCVAGERCSDQWELEEGEVLLHSGKAVLHLRADGTVNITGSLTVNGQPVMTAG
ncbi:hypothetical protein [uncultured Flavonifractor sp.]|uniref:hypothetical protein n=1 Tax=uncultured Flavonifractor sp. TaxID=1193534 RepID=UPI00261094BE|nr:hypothetical protein [uncultured Flavonifractor sp.]